MSRAACGDPPGALRGSLDRLYHEFNRIDAADDPIQIVRRYENPADREVVGLCAAVLAFGRVASVLQSIERLVSVLGPAPAAFARRFDPARDGPPLGGIVHRWIRGADLVALLWIVRRMLEDGSIEDFFLKGYDPAAADVGPALESFSSRAREVDLRPAYGRVPHRPGVHFFFPRPSSGGACLRLTRRRSPGWRMAAEITASLRALDPDDPVKYDFSLCHLGMASACGFGRRQGDARCPLAGHCRPRRRRRGIPPAAGRQRHG